MSKVLVRLERSKNEKGKRGEVKKEILRQPDNSHAGGVEQRHMGEKTKGIKTKIAGSLTAGCLVENNPPEPHGRFMYCVSQKQTASGGAPGEKKEGGKSPRLSKKK